MLEGLSIERKTKLMIEWIFPVNKIETFRIYI